MMWCTIRLVDGCWLAYLVNGSEQEGLRVVNGLNLPLVEGNTYQGWFQHDLTFKPVEMMQ